MSGALSRPEGRSWLKRLIVDNLLERPLPKKLGWFRCLGGIALVTFIVQVGTGIFMACFYDPSVSGAFSSVQYIKHEVPYGWLVSKLHLVGTQVMIGCVIAHLIRVLFKGAYKRPREFHWVSGVFLLILILFMGYTGARLPVGNVHAWNADEWHARADTRVYASPADTDTAIKYRPGSSLNRTDTDAHGPIDRQGFPLIYVVHVIVVPAVICCFMGFHFVMVRRTGISEPL